MNSTENPQSGHTFHIPVMGLAFTIDSPVKVARFGLSSVISIIEDNLIEKMRSYYYNLINEEYKPITSKEEDYRAKRITDYLNLVNKIVKDQFEKLKSSTFDAGSDLVLYFEMLPNDSKLKQLYLSMLKTNDGKLKEKLQDVLKSEIRPGSIDVNIMTKIDNNTYNSDGTVIENNSDAIAAFRGFAKSNLTDSSIIFSAGINPRLFNYIERFNQFITPTKKGQFEKKIVIKVSDYRSAIIQGKYLAKKGIWVSEFRVESGLNCGGHAFVTEGYLLGPILEEFKNKREELISELFKIYSLNLKSKGKPVPSEAPEMRITVQGGIGTYEEDKLLREYYNVDGTGWGSPLLLVPEATTVDNETLELLRNSKEEDIILSNNSPLGVRFNYLKGTSSEREKKQRILCQNPGSPCTERFLKYNYEFGEKPICVASNNYQKQKLNQIKSENQVESDNIKNKEDFLDKECLCIGLSNSAVINYEMSPIHGNSKAVTICPGPNLAYFSKVVTLKEMVDHIYGRNNILEKEEMRPHFFIKELELYVNYLDEQLTGSISNLDNKIKKYYQGYCQNLLEGINYYQGLSDNAIKCSETKKQETKKELRQFEEKILKIKQLFL